MDINTDSSAAVSPPTTNGGIGRPYTAASPCSPDYASSSAGGGGGTYIDDDRMSFESRFGARDTQFIGSFCIVLSDNLCQLSCFPDP